MPEGARATSPTPSSARPGHISAICYQESSIYIVTREPAGCSFAPRHIGECNFKRICVGVEVCQSARPFSLFADSIAGGKQHRILKLEAPVPRQSRPPFVRAGVFAPPNKSPAIADEAYSSHITLAPGTPHPHTSCQELCPAGIKSVAVMDKRSFAPLLH